MFHPWKVKYLHLPGQLLSYFCYGCPALQCALETLSADLVDYDDITEFRTEDFGRLTTQNAGTLMYSIGAMSLSSNFQSSDVPNAEH